MAVALFLSSCSGGKSEANKDTGKASAPTGLEKVKQVNKVVGVGMIAPESLITKLAAQLPGTVIEINKDNGDQVKAGDVILRLDDRDEQLALQKLIRERTTQKFQIEADKAGIEDTRVQLANAKANLEASENLQQTGAETLKNLDDLRTKVQSLQAELDQKKAGLDAAESQLEGIDIDIEQARLNIGKKVIRAPADGEILEIKAVLYSNVSQDEVLVDFAESGPVIARCEIDEMFADQVKVGQKAEIRHIGFDKVIATGTVIEMSPYLSQKSLFTENPTDQQDRRVRDVRIRLDNPDGLLFNSRVECTIKTK